MPAYWGLNKIEGRVAVNVYAIAERRKPNSLPFCEGRRLPTGGEMKMRLTEMQRLLRDPKICDFDPA